MGEGETPARLASSCVPRACPGGQADEVRVDRMKDRELMAQAVAAGELGRRTAPPNPWVGCVLVDEHGAVVGEGFHVRPGSAHAEAAAVAAAGARARGATAYVTLEPCAHHGRTGPCADTLVAAGVARVVVGVEDPDPQVAGRGVARLRDAGIAVDVGVGTEQVSVSLAPYLHHRRTGRAFCVVKTALSLDGRTAAADGSSRWITGREARADAHRLRVESQAVVIGAGTAVADRPSLTARDVDPPAERQPLRVVLDARGRVPAVGPLFDPDVAPTLVITTDAVDPRAADAWRGAGAKVETVPAGHGGVSLRDALELLGRDGIVQALVEGGAALHGSLLTEGLADWLVAYVAPTVLGHGGRPAFDAPGPRAIVDASRWQTRSVARFGDDIRVEYEPAG